MEIKYTRSDERICFYMKGELDEHYAKGVKEYIEGVLDNSGIYKKVVFNMSELDFMDSTGVGMLLGRYKRLKKMGVECFIEDPAPSVEKVIEVAGLYAIMPKI